MVWCGALHRGSNEPVVLNSAAARALVGGRVATSAKN
jgi:hypothetical protein